mgnify:CR=1 FL=1
MSTTFQITTEIPKSKIIEALNDECYEVISDWREAVDFLIDDDNTISLMYQERENIKMFFAQDKFKDIPCEELQEFLKKF